MRPRRSSSTQAEDAPDESKRVRWGVAFWIALGVLVLIVVIAITANWITPYDPYAQDLIASSQGPSSAHWLGTDQLGRDILSRLMVGSRTGIIGPAIVAICATVLGTLIGLWAGFTGGRTDSVTMRSIDVVYAIPPLLVAVVLVGLLGGGYWLAVAVLIVLSAPADVRVVRAAVMAQRELPYIAAARTLGLSQTRIALKHVLPNIAPTLAANALLQFVVALIALSGLAFLGIGVSAGTPDWGLMIAENRSILDLNPWAVIAPALCITMLAVAVAILGDRIFEVATDRGASR
jgi:ABC-type dipeptide/oligopeptide/nickel transport system permease subunit